MTYSEITSYHISSCGNHVGSLQDNKKVAMENKEWLTPQEAYDYVVEKKNLSRKVFYTSFSKLRTAGRYNKNDINMLITKLEKESKSKLNEVRND